MNRTTFFIGLAFVLLWNSGFIGAEYGLPYTGPFTLLLWRYLALTLVLALYLVVRGRLRWVGWPLVATHTTVGILAHGVWLAGVLVALDRGVPAGIVALVVALQPMATGALAGRVTGEPTPWQRWLGLMVGFGGVALAVICRIDLVDARSVVGYLLPLGSVVAITAASLMQRRVELSQPHQKLPIDLDLFYQALGTTLVVAVPALWLEHLYTRWSPAFIATLLWLILAVSLAAYALMWLLIRRFDATRVASLFYLGPPLTMLMAWMAFGDTLQLMDIVGLAVVLVGVALSTRG